ncbi:MAG: hypothetical protein LBQ82_00840 [Treponema sp.]|jgi:predicted small secreted protein|nr:hypothetical protein [Treponema sp.]
MKRMKNVILIFLVACFLFWSCDSTDHGKLGGADITDTYYPTDAQFKERLDFFCGTWSSSYDDYRIRKWSDFAAEDKERAQILFPSLDVDNPKTYSTQEPLPNSYYVVLYDDTGLGFGFMGLLRAINIFNGDKNRGALVIEYFEGADPLWLSDQGLTRGEKPFFGIYYKVLDSDTVQMANAVNLAAMYAGNPYYTEKKTLNEAIKTFNVENEAEFISWGVVTPYNRAK